MVGSAVLRLRRAFTRALLAGEPEAAERAARPRPPRSARVEAALDYLRHVHPRIPVVLGGSAITFELGAAWSASVCSDVSSVVESIDALVHRAPLN